MNRGHDSRFDTAEFVQNLCHRSQAVGGAAGVGHDVLVSGVVLVVVDTHDKHAVNVFSGSGQHDFLDRFAQVQGRLVALLELTRTLDNHLGAGASPIDVSRVLVSRCGDAPTVDGQRLVVICHFTVKTTPHGVVFEQVRELSIVCQVVDCHDL